MIEHPKTSMRKEFEAWAHGCNIDLETVRNASADYAYMLAQYAWQAWQAARAAPHRAGDSIPRIEANFGRGEIAITTGTHGGRPCVYLAPARMAASPGAPVSNAAEGLPPHAMREDESVLTFPTVAQAELVKLALAGQLPTGEPTSEVVAWTP